MAVWIKAESDNIYFRLLTESDMPTLALAMTGVDPFGVLPDAQVQKAFYYAANKQNSTMFASRSLQDDDKGWLNCTVCKSDDTVVGYWVGKYVGKRVNQMMSALIPAERSNGYYRELSVLRHRFIFDSLGAEESSIVIPTSSGSIDSAVRASLDDLYTTTEMTKIIANKGEYRRSVIQRADWDAWINSSTNATQKARAYNLEFSNA
tara:strand:- start:551 stop:1168 length:618 start_codon:yes stop_codon:yes gene_type:complete